MSEYDKVLQPVSLAAEQTRLSNLGPCAGHGVTDAGLVGIPVPRANWAGDRSAETSHPVIASQQPQPTDGTMTAIATFYVLLLGMHLRDSE